MHAITVAFDALLEAAAAAGPLEGLDDPCARLELSRRVRERIAQLNREMLLLEAIAVGLGCGAEVEIDQACPSAAEGEE